MSETKPCPFCEDEGRPYVQKWTNGKKPPDTSYSIQCAKCRSGRTRHRSTVEDAIQDWNLWPHWRRSAAGKKNLQEKKKLEERIYFQRARLKWWEELFNQHVHAHVRRIRPSLMPMVMRHYREGRKESLLNAIEVAKDYALDAKPDSEYALACNDLVEKFREMLDQVPVPQKREGG
jgi:hypothetical protein